MTFKRSDRVSELLRHEISTELQELIDGNMGLVTITGVTIADDLMDAKIFYSVLGSESQKQNCENFLHRITPLLRSRLGRRLESLRKIPTFLWVYDDTSEKAQRVDEILKQLHQEESVEGKTQNSSEQKQISEKENNSEQVSNLDENQQQDLNASRSDHNRKPQRRGSYKNTPKQYSKNRKK